MLASCGVYTFPAVAQTDETAGLPPVIPTVFDRLDVFRGQVSTNIFSTKIGGADAPMSLPVSMDVAGQVGNGPGLFSFNEAMVCTYRYVEPGRVGYTYLTHVSGNNSEVYNSAQATQECEVPGTRFFADGSTLTHGTPYSAQGFTYTDRDGGVSYFYYDGDTTANYSAYAHEWPIRKHIFPNGIVWTYVQGMPNTGPQSVTRQEKVLTTSLISSTGYRIDISYQSFPNDVNHVRRFPAAITFTSTTCLDCTEATIGSAAISTIDGDGTNYQYSYDLSLNSTYLGRLVFQGVPAQGAVVQWATVGMAFKGLTFASDATKYQYQALCSPSVTGCSAYSTVTSMQDGNGHSTTITPGQNYQYTGDVVDRNGGTWHFTPTYYVTPGSLNTPILTSVTDPLNRTTSYTWNMTYGKPSSVTKPDGTVVSATYDSRGNETSTTTTPAGGGTAIVVRRIFPTECASDTLRVCNKPTAIIDGRGNETDYTWSAQHGGLLTETKPADASGFRPVISYDYTAYTGIDGAVFYLLNSKTETIDASHTRTTTYEYDPSDHWERKSEIVDSGGLALRTCYKHDAIGNIISKTEPRAGLATCS